MIFNLFFVCVARALETNLIFPIFFCSLKMLFFCNFVFSWLIFNIRLHMRNVGTRLMLTDQQVICDTICGSSPSYSSTSIASYCRLKEANTSSDFDKLLR